jgi:hypothetical protein
MEITHVNGSLNFVIINVLVLALPYRLKPFKNSMCYQFFPESYSYTESAECLISVFLATHSDPGM